MLIHWIKNKQKQNPTTVAEIISMLQAGMIDESTLAWHKGCAQWMPLRDLPAMQSFFNKETAPSELTPEVLETSETPEPAEVEPTEETTSENTAKDLQENLKNKSIIMLKMPTPFQRFLARMLDLSLYGFIYMIIVYFRAIPWAQHLELTNPFIWMFFIPLEAVILNHFRTTPGKALLGIRLYSIQGREGLNLPTCLKRSFLVFALGVGMMLIFSPIPLFLIAMGLSYRKLTKQGYTSWDERCQTVLLQRRKPHPMRPFLAGFLTVYLCLNTLSLMAPWLPAMHNNIIEQSPESAQMLEDFKAKLPKAMQDAWPK
ncbi:MAG: RDD family protein [Akkermansia sp.]